MSALKPGFRVSTARSLINEIYFQRAYLYYFLGNITPWEDDFNPPLSANSLEDETSVRNDLFYMRRVVPNDVSLVTYNNTWEPDVVFEMWDHTREMEGTNFFVVNNENNVYKCLDNNNESPSTVEPLGTPLFAFTTGDGYMWKYMYNIPAFKRRKFLSRGFIPVQRAVSDTFYNKGAVEEAVVLSPGSGYIEILLTTLSVQDTRTGSGATAVITSVSVDGEITGISITNGGSNYANVDIPASVIIDSIGGSGAVIDLIITNGEITGVDIVDGGANYEITDTLDIVTEQCVLKPVISRDTGSFLDVVIINPGSGYASSPVITIVEDLVTGVGRYGNPAAVIKAFANQGVIANITIEDPGLNYGVDTSTIIVVQGDGEGASFAPVVVDGEIIDVVVENSGIGYSYINLLAVGAGTGAVIQGVITQSDFISDQSIIEQSTIPGAIHAIRVTEPGNNYSRDTQIEIVGDGIGAQAEPIIVDGQIVKINMTAFGSNYTRAQVVITDPIRPPSSAFIDAEAYATLPPYRGHGFDAPQELYGNVVSVYSLLQGDIELSEVGQDYRQYGIIKNPLDIVDGRRLTAIRYFVSFDIQVSDASTIEPDDILLNGSTRYRVISKETNKITVQQLSFRSETPVGSFAREDDPEVEYGISRIDSVPVADKYSGDLLFVTNTSPFTPTSEQVVAVRTYIET
jgi:hypothetical protein